MSDDQNVTGGSSTSSGRERIEIRSSGDDSPATGSQTAQETGSDTGSDTGGATSATPRQSSDEPVGEHREEATRHTPAATPVAASDSTTPVESPDRASIVARQKEAFGGVKPFVAFFGWLTATGMAVLLTALLTAVGASIGEINAADPSSAASSAGLSAEEITWIGVVVLLVVVFVAYYAGGYVAGRMARFDGMRQGVAVWLWAVVISVVVGALGYFFGSESNMLGSVSNLQLPTSGLSTQALVALIGIIVVSLVGAILGGLAGMHFHRKVDVAGLGR